MSQRLVPLPFYFTIRPRTRRRIDPTTSLLTHKTHHDGEVGLRNAGGFATLGEPCQLARWGDIVNTAAYPLRWTPSILARRVGSAAARSRYLNLEIAAFLNDRLRTADARNRRFRHPPDG